MTPARRAERGPKNTGEFLAVLAQILFDRMNRNIVRAFGDRRGFLPLGFLTGLPGINVGGIPGADNPHAFRLFVVMLLRLWGRKLRCLNA